MVDCDCRLEYRQLYRKSTEITHLLFSTEHVHRKHHIPIGCCGCRRRRRRHDERGTKRLNVSVISRKNRIPHFVLSRARMEFYKHLLSQEFCFDVTSLWLRSMALPHGSMARS